MKKEQDIPSIPELEALNNRLAKAINQATTSTTQEDRNKFTKEAQALKLTLSQKIAEFKSKLDPFELKFRQNFVLEHDLYFVGRFSQEGIATTLFNDHANGEMVEGYINRSGEFLNPGYKGANLKPFSEGFGLIRVHRDYYFLNEHGNLLSSVQNPFEVLVFQHANIFQEGLAVVTKRDNKTGLSKDYYLQPSGELIHLDKPYFQNGGQISNFSEGLAGVREANSMDDFYVDKKFNIAIPGPFFGINPFKEGLAATIEKNRKHAQYIKKDGSLAFNRRFVLASNFSEGLAHVVDLNKQSVYINKQGETCLEGVKGGSFIEGYDFSCGFALADVTLNGSPNLKLVLINKSGEIVVNFNEMGFEPTTHEPLGKHGVIECSPITGSSYDSGYVWLDQQGRKIFSTSEDDPIDKI